MAYALTLGAFSFLFAVIWGRPLITYLRRHRIGKQIRFDGPSSHQTKTGTPTMGGLMILVPVFVITLVAGFTQLLASPCWTGWAWRGASSLAVPFWYRWALCSVLD